MILQKKIRNIAQNERLLPNTIDKDWVLGHISFGIYTNKTIVPILAFKAKTACKDIVCYNTSVFFNGKNIKTLYSHWKAALGHHLADMGLLNIDIVIFEFRKNLLPNLPL